MMHDEVSFARLAIQTKQNLNSSEVKKVIEVVSWKKRFLKQKKTILNVKRVNIPKDRRVIFWDFLKSKKANIAVDPLLTNPLNSATKLQISTTKQN